MRGKSNSECKGEQVGKKKRYADHVRLGKGIDGQVGQNKNSKKAGRRVHFQQWSQERIDGIHLHQNDDEVEGETGRPSEEGARDFLQGRCVEGKRHEHAPVGGIHGRGQGDQFPSSVEYEGGTDKCVRKDDGPKFFDIKPSHSGQPSVRRGQVEAGKEKEDRNGESRHIVDKGGGNPLNSEHPRGGGGKIKCVNAHYPDNSHRSGGINRYQAGGSAILVGGGSALRRGGDGAEDEEGAGGGERKRQ